MKMKLLAVLAGAALCVSSTDAQTRKTQQENLERFEKYLGEPVEQFQFWSLYKWQLVGPNKVVVWPTINDAYLLTVDDPCPGLEWANGIGVTSKQRHLVSRKFDYVTYGKGRCQINEIRPIDYKTMLKDGPDAKAK
jgi:hypothetical protein